LVVDVAKFQVLRAFVCHDALLSLISGPSDQTSASSIVNLLSKLHVLADVTLKKYISDVLSVNIGKN
jgi:hypothetical protein